MIENWDRVREIIKGQRGSEKAGGAGSARTVRREERKK